MCKKKKTLYLLTAAFPYGAIIESFLESEVCYLANSFEKIVIIPLSGDLSVIREVPANCIVEQPIIRSRFIQYLHLFSYRSFLVFYSDFFRKKVFLNISRFKAWLIAYVLTNNYLHSRQIKNLFRNIKSDDVVYSYWGKGGCYLAPFYKGKARFISRFHGEWDLWEESSGNYAPVRKQVAESLSLAVFISEKGKAYFQKRYTCPTIVSRLGITSARVCHKKSNDGVIRILSCSSVYPLKRVPLIYEALQLIENIRVEWTHIGAGPDFEKLKELVQKSNENIKIILLGQMSNQEVLSYYVNHAVDLFINVSTNEGIPVSIMEAISYDIPVIGTNVGGTSEIVTNETGLLLSPNPLPTEIKEAILKISTSTFTPRNYWEKYYNADNNYSSFAQMIAEL